jgi:hypothetical protein
VALGCAHGSTTTPFSAIASPPSPSKAAAKSQGAGAHLTMPVHLELAPALRQRRTPAARDGQAA